MSDYIANLISFLALLLSCVSFWLSLKAEKAADAQIKHSHLFEIETKLDFIISNCQDYNEFLGYKVKNFQEDLILFCKEYGVDSTHALCIFANIYFSISNDGEDIEFSLSKISKHASDLLQFLKNA